MEQQPGMSSERIFAQLQSKNWADIAMKAVEWDIRKT
jgi:hypothetical protein